MVKITGPALSLDASGSLGQILTYQKKMGGNAVYMKSKPGARSPLVLTYNQYQNKIYTSEAVRHWHLLSAAEKALWDAFVK